jgi:hypothetical protein
MDELQTAKVVIPMVSEKSVKRPWVNFEAGAVWMKRIPIIPVCYSGLSVDNLPKPYSSLQAVDLDAPSGGEYLGRSIAHHLGIEEPPTYPFPLLLLRQEPHLGRLTLDPPALLNGPQVSINLNLVQGVLLVLAVLPLESGNVPVLIPPDVVAEIAVERSAMYLEERHFFVEASSVQTWIFDTLEAFQSLNRFIKSAIH